MMTTQLVALHSYPLKSARGIAHTSALLGPRGIEHDREWMLVDANDRFITQRELPRLALLQAHVNDDALELSAPGLAPLRAVAGGATRRVRIWNDRCAAIDAGDQAANALSAWTGRTCRLVRFDAAQPRRSDAAWTGELRADNAFSDGFPLLLLNLASLRELNGRLEAPLPTDRFRPNLCFDGMDAYAEDRLHELRCGPVVLRAVKPCTRCVITTTDQQRGELAGDEPLRTLRKYRHDRSLRGVTFCQNLIIVAGAGCRLAAGSVWQLSWRTAS